MRFIRIIGFLLVLLQAFLYSEKTIAQPPGKHKTNTVSKHVTVHKKNTPHQRIYCSLTEDTDTEDQLTEKELTDISYTSPAVLHSPQYYTTTVPVSVSGNNSHHNRYLFLFLRHLRI